MAQISHHKITRIRNLQFRKLRAFKPSNAQSIQSFDSSSAFKNLETKSFQPVEIRFQTFDSSALNCRLVGAVLIKDYLPTKFEASGAKHS